MKQIKYILISIYLLCLGGIFSYSVFFGDVSTSEGVGGFLILVSVVVFAYSFSIKE